MPMVDMIKTGENIKKFRQESNMSVCDVADITGVTERSVFKWQKGISVPSIDNLIVLAAIFHVTIDQIISTV